MYQVYIIWVEHKYGASLWLNRILCQKVSLGYCGSHVRIIFPSMTLQPLMIQGLIAEASRSHSVGLLWTSDQPFTKTCTCQNTDNRHIHAGGIRTRHPSKRSAANSRRRPRGQRARQEQIEWEFKVWLAEPKCIELVLKPAKCPLGEIEVSSERKVLQQILPLICLH
jgi:hypothetical protein